MKPITEQEWQSLIEYGTLFNMTGQQGKMNRLVEIALTSLNSVPVGDFYEDGKDDWWQLGPYDKVPRITPLYTAPPVPVIKFPNINLRIAGYRHDPSAPTKEWAFMDGAKWMASEIKRLNGIK